MANRIQAGTETIELEAGAAIEIERGADNFVKATLVIDGAKRAGFIGTHADGFTFDAYRTGADGKARVIDCYKAEYKLEGGAMRRVRKYAAELLQARADIKSRANS